MNLFEKNINALKSIKPKFYASFKDSLDEYNLDEKSCFSVNTAKDGNSYLLYECDGKSVRLNSNYNPVREAEQWAKQYKFSQYKSTAVMFGLGNGCFARAVLANMQNTDNMIILESDEKLFFKVLHEFDISDLINDTRLVLLLGEPSNGELFNTMTIFIHWANLSAMQVLLHPKYEDIYKQQYKDFDYEIDNLKMSMKTEGATEQTFGEEVAYNSVKNYKYIHGSHYFNEFIDAFPENTVGIVVAAGPSLDKNINVLHELKGKAVIFAVDTALRRLHAEGIVPDFTVSVDPKKPLRLFEDAGFEELPFFCKIDSNPAVLQKHTGSKIWVNPSSFFLKLYNRLNIVGDMFHSGGSVATTAFNICVLLRLNTIVLVGQDLAYADDGNATHAGGEKSSILYEEETTGYVMGNNGEMVKTRGDWFVYLKWFERYVRNLGDKVRVINATEGGALIEGTEIMTLKEVSDTLCQKEIEIKNIIDGILNNKHEEYDEIITDFNEECVSNLNAMDKSLEKAITFCNRFIRKYAKARTICPEVSKCMSEISKINKRIDSMPVYMLIDEIVKHKDMDSVKDIFNGSGDEYSDNMGMIKNTRHIFELTREAVSELSAEFKAAGDMPEA